MSGERVGLSMRRVGRWLSATIAAIVAMIVAGVSLQAFGQEADEDRDPCFLSDVQRFHEQVVNPVGEGAPSYFLHLAEDFIAQCPDRFEIRDAHMLAANAGLNDGAGEASLKHFEAALDLGVRFNMKERMDYATALLDQGQDEKAAVVQQSAMMRWAADITATGLADLELIEDVEGVAFRATFDLVDPDRQITSIWAFDPPGAALPALVVVRPDYMRAAWQNLRTGGNIGAVNVMEFVTCREKEVLVELEGARITKDAVEAASRAMKDYLKSPDMFEDFDEEAWVPTCFMLSRFVDVPRPETAVIPEIQPEF